MNERDESDPYEALRAWIDPETGGTLPLHHREAIRRLLAERDAWVEAFADLVRRAPQGER